MRGRLRPCFVGVPVSFCKWAILFQEEASESTHHDEINGLVPRRLWRSPTLSHVLPYAGVRL